MYAFSRRISSSFSERSTCSRSRSETIPRKRSPWITGKCRQPACFILRTPSSFESETSATTRSRVMTSPTLTESGSRPRATTRLMMARSGGERLGREGGTLGVPPSDPAAGLERDLAVGHGQPDLDLVAHREGFVALDENPGQAKVDHEHLFVHRTVNEAGPPHERDAELAEDAVGRDPLPGSRGRGPGHFWRGALSSGHASTSPITVSLKGCTQPDQP